MSQSHGHMVGDDTTSVISQQQLYNDLRAVIPAKAGIQIRKTGFRIKSGMTQWLKSFLRGTLEDCATMRQE
jgi:hypothetical protein